MKSPLRWPGGKHAMAELITSSIPKGVREYREPFAGAAHVFFKARTKGLAESYWLNDKFADLIYFYRTARNPEKCKRLVKALRHMRGTMTSAEQVRKYFDFMPQATTPEERALSLFFLNRVTYSGTTQAGGFSNNAAMKRFTPSSIDRVAALPEALENVRLTKYDYKEVIKAPGEDVFLYIDPPYPTAKKLYGPKGSLHEIDHEELATLLRQMNHQFLLSYPDTPQMRSLYDWASLCEATQFYGMTNCGRSKKCGVGHELIITNF